MPLPEPNQRLVHHRNYTKEALIQVRIAHPKDASELFKVRTSVRENLLTVEETATLSITHASLAAMIESGDGTGLVR